MKTQYSKLGVATLLVAGVLLAPALRAQTVTFKSGLSRVTAPLNYSGTASFTNRVSLSGVSNAVDLSVSGAPSGVTSINITYPDGTAMPVDNSLPSTTVSTNILISLNMSSVQEGFYTLSLNGNGGATNNWLFGLQVGYQWLGTNAGSTNWSDGNNWFGGGVPGANDDALLGQIGATNATTPINVVIDQNPTVLGGLRFCSSNGTAKFYNMQINPGVTLALGGTNGFSMLKDYVNSLTLPALGGMTVTISGQNGSLVITNEKASINDEVDNQANLLDMSQLGSFTADVNQMSLGDCLSWPYYRNLNDQNAYNGQPRSALTGINLAKTNFIKAIFSDPNKYTNADSRQYSLNWMNSELSGSSTAPVFNMGISNLFWCDSVNFVNGNSRGTLNFLPAFATSNCVAIFRGTNGGRMSVFSIDDGGGTNTANSNLKGTISFLSGTLDVMTDQLYIGRDRRLIVNLGTPNYQGFLLYKGVVDANNAVLGYRQYTQTNTGYAYNGYCEGSVTVSNNSTFRVNKVLTLGSTVATDPNALGSGGNTEWGQVVIRDSSSLLASNINVGGPVYASSKNNFITIQNNSSLTVSNSVGSPNTQGLDTLTFSTNGILTLHIDGNRTTPYVYATNLTTVGSNTIQIARIVNLGSVSGPVQLVQYSAGGGSFQGLVMPAGLGGALITTNNVGIWLQIISGTPKTVIWRGFSGSDWNLTTPNWYDPATGLQTNFANGDHVVFDDASVPTTVHLAGPVDIIPGSIIMSNSINSYVIDSASGGDIQGSATLTKWGSNPLQIDGSTTLNIQLNQATLLGSGSIGSAFISAGTVMNFTGSFGGGMSCAGTATISGNNNGGTLNILPGGTVTNSGTYSGPFATGAGSLLVNSGTINNELNSIVVSNATLLNSGDIHGQTLTIGGTFEDFGTGAIYMFGDVVNGTRGLTINPGGMFIPGGNGIGTTTVRPETGSPNNYPGRILFSPGSTNVFKVDPGTPASPGPLASTMLGSGVMGFGNNQTPLAFNGGTIWITNVSATAFAAGQQFTMFQFYTGGNFLGAGTNTLSSMPQIYPSTPGPGLAWDLSQLVTPGLPQTQGLGGPGKIGIRSINTTPVNMGYDLSFTTNTGTNGITTNLSVSHLTWPADHIGWRLESQVNGVGIGLSSNWSTFYASVFTNEIYDTNFYSTTNTFLPSNSACLFYRMAFP